MKPLPVDLAALASGGKAALARTLTALEASPDDSGLVALLEAAWAHPRGLVLGLTGPPGVGKSTLTNALIGQLRARGETVGVIAVDPSSRRTGGALLGDRTRIATDPEDAGAFIRSMAARDRLGGLAEISFPAAVLMRAVYDWVIVETVGVGQSETEIADVADLVAFCAQPGSGDALQFMKAGIMEVPDLILVTKGDLGQMARRAAADLRGALSLAVADAPDIAILSSQTGAGIEAALDLIAARAVRLRSAGDLARRREEQGRAWAESRLRESFGREGLALIALRQTAAAAPFRYVAVQTETFRSLLQKSLKDL